jgi:protein-S-isoprenylcysteine O-methyltransferase Ste14
VDLGKLLRQQWDRLAAFIAVAVGAVAVLLGWIGVSGHAYLANQLPYLISGGIGGLFLLGVGATLWISSDLRDEWHKLDRVERALDAARGTALLESLSEDAAGSHVSDDHTAVVR